jgi:mannose-6-phosphate isomerase-like protein (cupin superfamily)
MRIYEAVMKVHAAVPVGFVDSWYESVKELPGPQAIGFHYHDVEEWLTVVGGEITFFTLADEPIPVDVGRSLLIPRGEVHRVEVGSQGVEYRIFVPITEPLYANALSEGELEALRHHLKFPEYEGGRAENGREFFEDILSDRLMFCRANGKFVGKRKFIDDAFRDGVVRDQNRSSSGSIQVLNRKEKGLPISTVVEMPEAGSLNSYMNFRFLAKEGGKLRCRLWVNYPQLTPV